MTRKSFLLSLSGLAAVAILATSAHAQINAPTDLSGLRLWLDAADTGTITQAAGAVSQWNDKSGNAINVAQGTLGSQPLTGGASLNGLNVLTFDGSNDFLAKTGGTLPLAGGDDTYTYFAVWKPDVQKLASVYEQSQSPQATGTRSALLQIGGNYGFNGESNDAHVVSYAPNAWRLTSIENDGVAPNITITDNTLFDNPRTFNVSSSNLGAQSVGTTGIRVGNKLTNNGENFDGNLAELVVYDRVLTAGEKTDVLNYLSGKFDLARSGLDSLAHRWSFNDGTANDSIGTANGTLNNGASIAGGQLSLDGVNDFVQTSAIDNSLTSKTLVAWVTLGDLSQQAGSALTIEAAGGGTFDGIVFGEQTAGQWLNGSNGFTRSQPFPDNGGALETSLGEVMMAIVYDADGSISLYRDGEFYASQNDGGPVEYLGGNADILFGLRHIGAGGDPFLEGLINEGRLYGVALTQDELRTLFQLGPNALQPAVVPEPASLLVWLTVFGICLAAVRFRRRAVARS